jgi:hypothetical protein
VPAEATVGAVIETDDGNGETVATTETRGEAAKMLEEAADGANEGQNIKRVTGKEVEADVPALARLVRVPAQGSFEELHEVERLDTHNVRKRKGEDFHEVVMPATDNRFAEQCEYVNLDVHQQNGEVHLVMTREDRGQPVTRPLDCQSKGSVIDTRETWMFRYGKPSAIHTGEGTLFGGLFGEWCNHRSIKHRTRQGIGPLRSKEKAMRPGGRTLAYGWPRDFLRQFWLQWYTQIWQHDGTTKRKDGHNYTSPQRQVNRDSEESSTGHYSDPTEFSEDDDDSNPKCSPLRCTIPHSESSDDVIELNTSSESSNHVAGLDTDSVSSNSAVELEREEPAMNFGFLTRERRDRLLGRAADRVEELASLLNTPVNKRRGADAALSKADIKQKIEELCTMQRQLKE